MDSGRQRSSRQPAPTFSDEYLKTTIKALHKPGTSDSKVKQLFRLTEGLFDRTTQSIGAHSEGTLLVGREEKISPYVLKDFDKLMRFVESIACQITSDILNGFDAHSITHWVLIELANYTWEDKVMLTLIAFVLTFSDFWILIRIYSTNAINEPITNNHDLPPLGNKDAYTKHLKANNDCINELVNAARYIIDIEDLTSTYFSKRLDRIPTDGYWIVRSTIVAATQIIVLSSRGPHQYVKDVKACEESTKLKDMSGELRRQLYDIYIRIGPVFTNDNIKFIRSLIHQENDSSLLYNGATQGKVDDLEILRSKYLLLLISGLNIAEEDILKLTHSISYSKPYEIVWIPVVDSSSPEMNDKFESLRKAMPWYSINQLSTVTEATTLFFKNEWHFRSSPILVVLSPEGEILNKNAIHMVRIWQNLPVDNLTSEVEGKLWENETWNLKLLVNAIDSTIQEWIRDEKYIFLYGGSDVNWIRKFTRQTASAASALQVEIKMVYMGLNYNKDHVRRVNDTIINENLTHCLSESTKNFFWSRVNSMIYSKLKLGTTNGGSGDTLFQEILKFHNHKEWALLAKGSKILVHGPGQLASTALDEIQVWKERGIEPGYVNQFQMHNDGVPHCHEIFLPVTEDAPTQLMCPSCQSNMENFFSLMCC